jgi:peptide/nickel transport system permease protein
LIWVFLVCFLLLRAMPGDPADRLDSPTIPAEQLERNRRALGLDRSLAVQFVQTASSYSRGELGISTSRKRPVIDVLRDALPATMLLGGSALFLAYGLGLAVAVSLVNLRQRMRRGLDQLLLVAAVIPRFWLGVLLILAFHDVAGWFPASHAQAPGGAGWGDRLHHLVLPVLTLGLPAACIVARYQLATMMQVLADPHVRAARATGAGGARLVILQVLRPSLGTAVALFAIDLPIIVSGAIVVEVVFAWPGVGRLTAEAILGGDYPLALAAALLAASVVILGRVLAEMLSAALSRRPLSGAARGAA